MTILGFGFFVWIRRSHLRNFSYLEYPDQLVNQTYHYHVYPSSPSSDGFLVQPAELQTEVSLILEQRETSACLWDYGAAAFCTAPILSLGPPPLPGAAFSQSENPQTLRQAPSASHQTSFLLM